jgi:hypothetical protein
MSKLKYNYKEHETPEERLRNKLQPFWYLVSLACDSTDPDIKSAADMCNKNLDGIVNLLDDIEPFYNKK